MGAGLRQERLMLGLTLPLARLDPIRAISDPMTAYHKQQRHAQRFDLLPTRILQPLGKRT